MATETNDIVTRIDVDASKAVEAYRLLDAAISGAGRSHKATISTIDSVFSANQKLGSQIEKMKTIYDLMQRTFDEQAKAAKGYAADLEKTTAANKAYKDSLDPLKAALDGVTQVQKAFKEGALSASEALKAQTAITKEAARSAEISAMATATAKRALVEYAAAFDPVSEAAQKAAQKERDLAAATKELNQLLAASEVSGEGALRLHAALALSFDKEAQAMAKWREEHARYKQAAEEQIVEKGIKARDTAAAQDINKEIADARELAKVRAGSSSARQQQDEASINAAIARNDKRLAAEINTEIEADNKAKALRAGSASARQRQDEAIVEVAMAKKRQQKAEELELDADVVAERAKAQAALRASFEATQRALLPVEAEMKRYRHEQEMLTASLKSGLIPSEEEYQKLLAASKANHGAQKEGIEESTKALAMNGGALREVFVMMHEMGTGQTSRLAGSAWVLLAERTSFFQNILAGTISTGMAWGIAAAGVTVGILGVAAAAYYAAEQVKALKIALQVSGGGVGLTSGQMDHMATEASKYVGSGNYREIAASAMMQGNVHSQSMKQIFNMSKDMSVAMGTTVVEAGDGLAKSLQQPTQALQELADKYHAVSDATVQYAHHLEASGEQEKARKLFLDEQGKAIKNIAEVDLFSLEKAWHKVGEVAKAAWEASLVPKAFTTESAEDAVTRLQKELSRLVNGKGQVVGTEAGDKAAELAAAERRKKEEQDKAAKAEADALRREAEAKASGYMRALDPQGESAKVLTDELNSLEKAQKAFNPTEFMKLPGNAGNPNAAFEEMTKYILSIRQIKAAIDELHSQNPDSKLKQEIADSVALTSAQNGNARTILQARLSAEAKWRDDAANKGPLSREFSSKEDYLTANSPLALDALTRDAKDAAEAKQRQLLTTNAQAGAAYGGTAAMNAVNMQAEIAASNARLSGTESEGFRQNAEVSIRATYAATERLSAAQQEATQSQIEYNSAAQAFVATGELEYLKKLNEIDEKRNASLAASGAAMQDNAAYARQLADIHRQLSSGDMSTTEAQRQQGALQAAMESVRKNPSLDLISEQARQMANVQAGQREKGTYAFLDANKKTQLTAQVYDDVAAGKTKLADADEEIALALRRNELEKQYGEDIAENIMKTEARNKEYVDGINDAQAALEKHKKVFEDLATMGEQSFDKIGTALTKVFTDGKTGAADFKNVFATIQKEQTAQMVKLTFTNPIENMIYGDNAKKMKPTIFDLFAGKGGDGSTLPLLRGPKKGLLVEFADETGPRGITGGGSTSADLGRANSSKISADTISQVTELAKQAGVAPEQLYSAWQVQQAQGKYGGSLPEVAAAMQYNAQHPGGQSIADYNNSIPGASALMSSASKDWNAAVSGGGAVSGGVAVALTAAARAAGLKGANGGAFQLPPGIDKLLSENNSLTSGINSLYQGSWAQDLFGGTSIFGAGNGAADAAGAASSLSNGAGNVMGIASGIAGLASGQGGTGGMVSNSGSVIGNALSLAGMPEFGIPIQLGSMLFGSLLGGGQQSVGPNGDAQIAFSNGKFGAGPAAGDNGFDPSGLKNQVSTFAKQLNALTAYGVSFNADQIRPGLSFNSSNNGQTQEGADALIKKLLLGNTSGSTPNSAITGEGAIGVAMTALSEEVMNTGRSVSQQELQTIVAFASALNTATKAMENFGVGLDGATKAAENSADQKNLGIKQQLVQAQQYGIGDQWQFTEQQSLGQQITALTDPTNNTSAAKALATLKGQISGINGNAEAAGVSLDKSGQTQQLGAWVANTIQNALGGTDSTRNQLGALSAEHQQNIDALSAAGLSTSSADTLFKTELAKLFANIDSQTAFALITAQGGAASAAWSQMAHGASPLDIRQAQASAGYSSATSGSSLATLTLSQNAAAMQRQAAQAAELNAATDDVTKAMIAETQAKENATTAAQNALAIEQTKLALATTNANLMASAYNLNGMSGSAASAMAKVNATQMMLSYKQAGGTDFAGMAAVANATEAKAVADASKQQLLNAYSQQISGLQANSTALQKQYGALLTLNVSMQSAIQNWKISNPANTPAQTLAAYKQLFDTAVSQFNTAYAKGDVTNENKYGAQVQQYGQGLLQAEYSYYGGVAGSGYTNNQIQSEQDRIFAIWQNLGGVSQDALDAANTQISQNTDQIALLNQSQAQAQQIGVQVVGSIDALTQATKEAYGVFNSTLSAVTSVLGVKANPASGAVGGGGGGSYVSGGGGASSPRAPITPNSSVATLIAAAAASGGNFSDPTIKNNDTAIYTVVASVGSTAFNASPQAMAAAQYFAANPDVLAAYQSNNNGANAVQFAEAHFQQFGSGEGRTGFGLVNGGMVGAFANGGMVGNGAWNKDSVLARYAGGGSIALAGGEFVVSAPNVAANLNTLNAINSGANGAGGNAALVSAVTTLTAEVSTLRLLTSNGMKMQVDLAGQNVVQTSLIANKVTRPSQRGAVGLM